MDEPFGPLDAQTRQIMGNLLLELWNADRKAVLFCHPRSRGSDRARRPRRDHVGGPSARIIGDWRVRCRARATFRKCGWRKISRAASGNLERAEGTK